MRKQDLIAFLIVCVMSIAASIGMVVISLKTRESALTNYEHFITEMWPKRCENQGLALRECYIKWNEEKAK